MLLPSTGTGLTRLPRVVTGAEATVPDNGCEPATTGGVTGEVSPEVSPVEAGGMAPASPEVTGAEVSVDAVGTVTGAGAVTGVTGVTAEGVGVSTGGVVATGGVVVSESLPESSLGSATSSTTTIARP